MKRTRGNHPTLADVARLAGVGKATVSRVINGGKKVSPETLKRINTVIRDLGYQPSQAARSLKGEGTKAIGFILPSIADPFFAGCAEAAQKVARANGYLMIVAATKYDAQTEIHQVESLIRHRVEGILLAPANTRSRPLATLVNGLQIPVITLDHPLEHSQVQSVVCDNRTGARKATEHLTNHGYRRVICLGGDSRLYTIRERQSGYAKAIRSAGFEPLMEPGVNTYVEIESTLRAYCVPQKRIDAIFAVRNVITSFAFQALQSLGLTIPGEVALVGFDDFDLACTLRPAVTVVRQPVEHIGTRSAELLFEQLNSPVSHNRRGASRITLKTTLIVRNSCGCL